MSLLSYRESHGFSRGEYVKLISCVIMLSALSGCFGYVKPREGDRQVLDQTQGAGRFVAATAKDPVVKQAGADVDANVATLKKNLIGEPERSLPYSPKASSDARGESDKEHSSIPWYKRFWAYVLYGATAILPMVRIMAGFFPAIGAFFAGPIGGALELVVKKLVDLKQRADANPDDKLHLDDLLSMIKQLTQDPRTGPIIKTLLAKYHLENII